jgi:hypothetical protein
MYYLIVVIFTILTITYGCLYYLCSKRINWRLNIPVSTWLKRMHYLLITIVGIDLILISTTEYHYKGLWTSRIFIITYVITGLLIYQLVNKSVLNRLERIYFIVSGYLPVVLGLFALIPFLGAFTIFTFGMKLFYPAEEILFNNEDIRIQSSIQGPMGSSILKIVEKDVITERTHHSVFGFSTEDYDSLIVVYNKDSIHIRLTTDRFWVVNSDTIHDKGLFFTVQNRKQHMFNSEYKVFNK